MASNLTPKQERFCTSYWELGNATNAYKLVYNTQSMNPETINREAKRLLDNPKIATRLDEIRILHTESHKVTVESITTELEFNRELALHLEQPSAANQATMGKAKIHGLIQDKSHVELVDERDNTTALDAVHALLNQDKTETKH